MTVWDYCFRSVRCSALCAVAVFSALAFLASPACANVTFVINNLDGAGEGFNDPTLGASRMAAFSYAAGLWSSILGNAYAGETINIDANFNPLGGSAGSAILGSAGAEFVHRDFTNVPIAGTWYGSPLANHKRLADLIPGTPEMSATFNSDVDNGTVLGATNWYYGTDASPGIHVDFVTVALHEIGHGLNFFDLIDDGAGTFFSGFPGIYDRFLISMPAGGTALTAMTNAERLTAITSDSVYWSGTNGVAGNSGTRPKIYAPSPYQPGSSISHLDETVHTSELMSPFYSGPDHTPSAIEIGMLKDMGWTIVPEPSSLLLAACGLIGLFASCARRGFPARSRRLAG